MHTKEYIQDLKKRIDLNLIINKLNNLKDLKVLVIGEPIIDEYVFTLPKGRAIKDPILSLDFIKSEKYAGGILAIANHIADFVDSLTLVTILGDYMREEELIRNILKANINLKLFTKKNSPTINKTRYIDDLRKTKLFKVEYINDKSISEEQEKEVMDYLKEELPKYELVVIGDFGHGFISNNIVKVLEKYSKSISANVQTNSSNMGYNYITKYNKIDYLTSNEPEVRLALSDRFGSFERVINKLEERTNFRNILITQGSDGCLLVKNNKKYIGPSLTSNVKDIVGAGDAVFAVTSLLNYKGADEELLIFIANSVGALAVNIIGNKESIKKENLIKFIEKLFNKAEKEDVQNELE